MISKSGAAISYRDLSPEKECSLGFMSVRFPIASHGTWILNAWKELYSESWLKQEMQKSGADWLYDTQRKKFIDVSNNKIEFP